MNLPLRRLGSTGMAVSVLGLGTVKLGRNEGVKYPAGFALPNDKQAAELLNLARDNGINLIDTAPAYGSSEARLGGLLGGQRQHWRLCTKVGEDFAGGISTFDFTRRHTRFSVERSLRRLRTDVLDIVLVHSDGNDLDIINRFGTLETLADLKREGKLRAYGMSSKTVSGGLAAARLSDVVMVTWNLRCQDDLSVIDFCLQNDKGVLIKKALASGHAASETEANNSDQQIAKTMAMIMAHPGVSSAVIGTINPQHLQANIDTVNRLDL